MKTVYKTSILAVFGILAITALTGNTGLIWIAVPFALLAISSIIAVLTKPVNKYGLSVHDTVLYFPYAGAKCYDGFKSSLPSADALEIGEIYEIEKVCGELIMLKGKQYFQHSSQFIKF